MDGLTAIVDKSQGTQLDANQITTSMTNGDGQETLSDRTDTEQEQNDLQEQLYQSANQYSHDSHTDSLQLVQNTGFAHSLKSALRSCQNSKQAKRVSFDIKLTQKKPDNLSRKSDGKLINRGTWTEYADQTLIELTQQYGRDWKSMQRKLGDFTKIAIKRRVQKLIEKDKIPRVKKVLNRWNDYEENALLLELYTGKFADIQQIQSKLDMFSEKQIKAKIFSLKPESLPKRRFWTDSQEQELIDLTYIHGRDFQAIQEELHQFSEVAIRKKREQMLKDGKISTPFGRSGQKFWTQAESSKIEKAVAQNQLDYSQLVKEIPNRTRKQILRKVSDLRKKMIKLQKDQK